METVTPDKLGRYEIVGELGRGAMGTVYLAQDPLIGRLLAVKTFNGEAGSDRSDRGPWTPAPLHEAQAAGLLNHPNIVSIHDLSEDPGGGAFIAMEYVRGTDLKEILEPQAPLPADFIAHVVGEVAAALDHAHGKGVIHGDVKPANLLIGDREEVKVTDFGIARKVGGAEPDDGDSLGTPSYASPEQVLGGQIDHRSDVFALGVVLFEMLTGQRPFVGDTASEVIGQIAREPPRPLLEDLPGIAPEVRGVVLTALSKDPGERYQSAGELAVALRRAMTAGAASPELGATQDLSDLLEAVATGPLPVPEERRIDRRPATFEPTPEPPRGSVSLRRLRLGLALALLPCLGVGGLALARIYNTASGAGPVAEGHDLRQRYVPLLREGRRLLRAGDPEQAARILRRAESLAPAVLALTRLQRQAEREMADAEAYSARQQEIYELLERGRHLLELGMADQARLAVNEVLALEPGHDGALEMAARVETLDRERTGAGRVAEARRRAEESAAAGALAENPAPQPIPLGPSPTAVTRYARLQIDFFSNVSKGVLVIYSGSTQIVRQPFRFFERSGWLRRRPISGRVELLRQLPAGRTPLRIYLARNGEEGSSLALELDLKAGRTHAVRLVAAKSGELTAELD